MQCSAKVMIGGVVFHCLRTAGHTEVQHRGSGNCYGQEVVVEFADGPVRDHYPRSFHLVCEALVRRMRDGKRWSAIEEAWEALVHVKQMGDSLEKEARHIAGAPNRREE